MLKYIIFLVIFIFILNHSTPTNLLYFTIFLGGSYFMYHNLDNFHLDKNYLDSKMWVMHEILNKYKQYNIPLYFEIKKELNLFNEVAIQMEESTNCRYNYTYLKSLANNLLDNFESFIFSIPITQSEKEKLSKRINVMTNIIVSKLNKSKKICQNNSLVAKMDIFHDLDSNATGKYDKFLIKD